MSVGAICSGVNKRYFVMARWHGFRKYEIIGKDTRSYKVAMRRLAEAMASNANYKRGGVFMIADYYDAIQVMEMVRR